MSILLLLAARAGAATLVVDGSTYASISDAVSAASDGDILSIAPGTWYDCVNLAGKSLTLTGAGGSAVTTLDAGGTCGAALTSTTGSPVVIIEGLTIRNHNQGGVRLGSGTCTLDDIVFTDLGNTSNPIYAIYATLSTLTVENTSIDDTVPSSTDIVVLNTATTRWTAVSVAGDSVVYTYGGTVDLEDHTFDGARLSAENGADVAISGGTFANTATDASVTLASATLTVSGATFADNMYIGGHFGAAIHATDADVTVSSSEFRANAAGTCGGAVYSDGNVTESGNTWSGNTAGVAAGGGNGGAIAVGGTLTSSGSTYSGNSTASGYGGAIYTRDVVVDGSPLTRRPKTSRPAIDAKGLGDQARDDAVAAPVQRSATAPPGDDFGAGSGRTESCPRRWCGWNMHDEGSLLRWSRWYGCCLTGT